jgi:hypothetical protein
VFAASASALDPILAVKHVRPNQSVFKGSSPRKPLVIRTAEQAAEHFAKDQLEALNKQVDFQKQVVLLFAWRGSGQDRLGYVVMESYPEQIGFTYKPGRTRDLRPHVHIFALRSNVKWSVR